MTVREYYIELKTEHIAWQKLPRRMLRHRTLQQCMRLSFGIASPEHYLAPSLPSITPKLKQDSGVYFYANRPIMQNRIDTIKNILVQK